ncbi:MAG: YihY/virulence factor BrkB family protein [Ferrovibrio sp.]|uniref:YihY/virulence factor BrkB family protein n=1 Tax=Ferrovibrio sp. TaxID=1917215 RepID=UPI002607C240|nr:YihY/virulence factor BrkB family protein [Ferrovibrio sp.]MCW0236402.1 YihY/virulence factor BrkB family protein [Ferrovibrio sp.]
MLNTGRLLFSAGRAMVNSLSFELAGHIAYTGLLAIFPFLIFLAALAGFLGTSAGGLASVQSMLDLLPQDVARTLAPVIHEVLDTRDGGLLTLGLLGALWVASNGIDALRIALNTAYDIEEERPWWLIKLGSIGAIIVGGIVFLMLSVLVVLGPVIWKGLLWLFPLGEADRWAFGTFRYLLAALVMLAGLLALHRWLPGKQLPVLALLPGVMATTALWLAAASLFSLYVAELGSYSATYGSLGGVIITLVFFYVSAVLFIFGAELNAALLRRKSKKPPSPPAEALADR